MDPISIVATVANLVGTALKGIQTINKYRSLYSRADITIASLTAQCSCVEFALLQIQDVVMHSPQSTYRLRSESALATHFSSVFGACETVFSILNQRLRQLVDCGVDQYGTVGPLAKLKQVWDDQEMKDLVRNIESQASAVNLLLGALQMRGNAEILDLLGRRESQILLDRVSNDATSLRSAEDAKMRVSSTDITPSCHSTFDEREFTFDFELINTTTYRKAFYCAPRHKAENGESSTTKDLQKPPIQESKVPDLITFPEEDDVMEALVTEGAQKLTNPEYNGIDPRGISIYPPGDESSTAPSFGHFAPPPNQTHITTPKIHKFEVAEIVLPSALDGEHVPSSEQRGKASEAKVETGEVMTEIRQALGEMMFSEYEDLMPLFTAEVAPSLQPDRIMEPNCTLLVDVSIPEAKEAEAPESATACEDLMEINAEFLTAETSMEAVTKLDNELGLMLYLKRTEVPTLRDFLQYLAAAEPIYVSKTTVINAGSIEQAMEVIPWTPFETENGVQLVTSSDHPQPLSSLTRYVLEELVHSSTSSRVIKGRKPDAEKAFAIKVMSRYSSATRLKSETDRLKSIHLEVAILHDLSHYNIIRVHELIELEMRIVVVMLYASPCTLLQYIQEQRKGAGVWCFPEMMAWSIFRQLISGVEYLHENLTIHRNLTLETILFDCKQNRAVITGFSIAEIAGKGSGQGLLGKYSTRLKYFCRPKFINPYFTAPEVLERYDSPFEICGTVDIEGKADVYSCGVILYTMINGVIPYGGNMLMTQFGPFHTAEHLKNLATTEMTKVLQIHRGDSCSYDLLRRLLQNLRELRYDIHQTALHSWMQVQPVEKLVKGAIRRKPIANNKLNQI